MEGNANPAFSSDVYSAASSPTTQPRRRVANKPADDASDGIFYQSSWAGMDDVAVQARSSHRGWRSFRLATMVVLVALWLAMLITSIVLLALGNSSGDCQGAATRWYDVAVGYQISPASYQDSDGDGVGDIQGILSRLDYLEFLGVDALWLGTICPSYGVDLWMDITDFTAVDGVYGTMQDFEALVKAVHAKGVKLILEFIPNHSSDLHQWFQESRQGPNNDFSDYYIWADGSNGGPPRYTETVTGNKPSWEYDSTRRQWYMFSFIKEEPALNYRDPSVIRDMQSALRFWLDKGVDGFYIRHIDHIFESLVVIDSLRSIGETNGVTSSEIDSITLEARNKTLDVIAGWRQLLDEYETPNESQLDNSKLLVVDTGSHLSLTEAVCKAPDVIAFNSMFLALTSPLDGHQLREAIESWMAMRPADASRLWAVGTADVSRIASRSGDRFAPAMMLLALLLPGSPLIYYGDEIGMTDGQRMETASINESVTEMMRSDRELTRSPMQWSPDVHAGFTDVSSEPWITVGINASAMNVQLQQQDNGSLLAFMERSLRFRRNEWTVFGAPRPDLFRLQTTYKEIVAFTREAPSGPTAVFAAINVAQYEVTENFENMAERIPGSGVVVVASDPKRLDQSVDFSRLLLRSGEALVVQYEPLKKPNDFS